MNDSFNQMDRIVKQPFYRRYIGWFAGVVVVFSLALLYLAVSLVGVDSNAMRLERGSVDIGVVRRGSLERYITTRGVVEARNTVILSAAVAGRVEDVYVRSGEQLTKGQSILQMSNPQLEINVLEVEGDILRQSSLLTSTEIGLNDSRADLTQRKLQVAQEMQVISLRLGRNRELRSRNLASEAEVEDDEARLANLQLQMDVLERALEVEKRIRESQLVDLRGVEARLRGKLELANSYLDSLNVKAPINGEVVEIVSEIGELKDVGDELGTVVDRSSLYLLAQVDEFYAGRVSAGQSALIEYDDASVELQVSHVRPQVVDGNLWIELDFENLPSDLKIGQSFTLKISYGDSKEALLVDNGPFVNQSGGRWAFVLSEDGNRAIRSPIEIGERNSQFIEIKSGADVGDQIIVSSYREFESVDEILFN